MPDSYRLAAPTYEDLGGPTPRELQSPDDDSAKAEEPGGTLKQVKGRCEQRCKTSRAPCKRHERKKKVLDTEETIEEEETPLKM